MLSINAPPSPPLTVNYDPLQLQANWKYLEYYISFHHEKKSCFCLCNFLEFITFVVIMCTNIENKENKGDFLVPTYSCTQRSTPAPPSKTVFFFLKIFFYAISLHHIHPSPLLRNALVIFALITFFITCSLSTCPLAAIFPSAFTSSKAHSSLITYSRSLYLAIFIYRTTNYSSRRQFSFPSPPPTLPLPLPLSCHPKEEHFMNFISIATPGDELVNWYSQKLKLIYEFKKLQQFEPSLSLKPMALLSHFLPRK